MNSFCCGILYFLSFLYDPLGVMGFLILTIKKPNLKNYIMYVLTYVGFFLIPLYGWLIVYKNNDWNIIFYFLILIFFILILIYIVYYCVELITSCNHFLNKIRSEMLFFCIHLSQYLVVGKLITTDFCFIPGFPLYTLAHSWIFKLIKIKKYPLLIFIGIIFFYSKFLFSLIKEYINGIIFLYLICLIIYLLNMPIDKTYSLPQTMHPYEIATYICSFSKIKSIKNKKSVIVFPEGFLNHFVEDIYPFLKERLKAYKLENVIIYVGAYDKCTKSPCVYKIYQKKIKLIASKKHILPFVESGKNIKNVKNQSVGICSDFFCQNLFFFKDVDILLYSTEWTLNSFTWYYYYIIDSLKKFYNKNGIL
jgi:hypothetical protein